jgi:hypothetical protein
MVIFRRTTGTVKREFLGEAGPERGIDRPDWDSGVDFTKNRREDLPCPLPGASALQLKLSYPNRAAPKKEIP